MTIRTSSVCCLFLLLSGAVDAQEVERLRPFRIAQDLQILTSVGPHGPLDMLGLFSAAHLLRLERQDHAFWETPHLRKAAAAAELVLERQPLTFVVMRSRGKDLLVWDELGVDRVPELDPALLAKIKDRTVMPDFRETPPDKRRKEDVAAYDLFCEAVGNAARTPVELFAAAAQENAHVTFAHLWNEPGKYRGKVIPIKGQLLRVRRFDAPNKLLDQNIKFVYEGWIKGPTKDSTPFVVIFPVPADDPTSPTKQLEPAERMDRPVTFYGYYYKKFRYPVEVGTGDQRKTSERESPMLIGPTVIVGAAPPVPPAHDITPVSYDIFAILFGFGLVVVSLVVGLNWWFRRGDRKFRKQLADLHAARALDMIENEEDKPAPPV